MELQFTTMNNGINLIKLTGKLDIGGAGQIETKFAAYSGGDQVRVIVDLSEVSFLASIGIRILLINAKSVARRGGKMVLLNPISEVYNVLEMAGILEIISVYPDLNAAETALLID